MNAIKRRQSQGGLRAYAVARSTRSAEERDAEIVSHLPLVHSVVERIAQHLPHTVDKDDLFHAGVIGLIEAIDRFDHSRETAFSTYAVLRIRGSIMDDLRARDCVSRGVRARTREYQEAVHELTNTLGHMPDDSELAAHLRCSQDELLDLERQTQLAIQVSIDSPTGENGTLGDLIQHRGENNPDLQLERDDLRELLARVLGEFKEQERLVVKLYYYENMLMKEIALVLGVTESRICQIHSRIMALLRSKLARVGIDPDILR
jgi:RNA polymerase sigma factor for flagellar operon FliA